MRRAASVAVAVAGAVAVAVAVAGCGGSEVAETTEVVETDETTGDEGEAPPPPVVGRLITVGPAFVPDPFVVEGEAGGTVMARTLAAECEGFVAEEPDHLLTVEGELAELWVMAQSGHDVTLVVQRPDQSVVCNDDFQETHPRVTLGPAVAGVYRIWVGSYEEGGRPSPYHLGVTAQSTLQPSLLSPGEDEAPLDLGEGEGVP